MRVMAFDIGKTRIGIAISDPDERIASPVCVLPAVEVVNDARSFRTILEDWEPELLVFGLPVSLDGTEGPQAKEVRQVAERISRQVGIPLEYADERLSSVEAKRSLREKGYTEKTARGKVDMIAASLFLQAWLDHRAAKK